MRNLTLASAQHLLTQGHITPQHHAKIVASVKPRKMPFAKSPAPRMFGSLGMRPQQAQAPIPAVGMGVPPSIPTGTSSGYDDAS